MIGKFARRVVKATIRGVLSVLYRVKLTGDFSQTVKHEKLLIIANHESFLDGLLLGVYLPSNPVFVVHTSVPNNFLFKILLSMVDYLAVDPSNPMAMKKVIKLINEGRPVVIFPEGRLTITGSMMKVYDGPAFVAAKTGATVLPIRIDGAARTYFSRLSGQHARKFFPKISISVMEPTTIEMSTASMAKIRRKKTGEDMRKIMQKMVFDSQPVETLYSSLLEVTKLYGSGRRILGDVARIKEKNESGDSRPAEYSYKELLKMVIALGLIVEKESEADECVGILMPNLAATVCIMIGAGAYGRAPAMLNYKSGSEGMSNACTAANIKTIFTMRAFIENQKLEADIAGIKGVRILYLEDLKAALTAKDKRKIAYGMLFPSSIEKKKNPDATAVVLFTSGSEGKPKGVVLSHRALLSNIAQIKSIIAFAPTDKVLNALPIFHSFGLTGGALLPLLSGMKLFLYTNPLHYRVIPELSYDGACTVLFGTNTFLANYAKHANAYDFFSLRYVVAGAEKLSDAVSNLWFEKFGIRIMEGYGATETAPVLAVNTPMAFKKGTVGQLLPSIDYKLIPVPGIEKGGMLHVKGPNVMSGYYRFEAPGVLQAPTSEAGNGWYETGDIVDIDDDGFVSIVGRVKRFAKIAGEMVSLEVVEKIAVTASPTFLHASSSKPDADKGESLVLFTTDPALSRTMLVDACKALGYSELSVPRNIKVVDSLPLLGTGKIDYVTLKTMC